MREYIIDGKIKVIVKPNAKKTEILGYDETKKALRIAVAAVPDKDRANKELIRFISKRLGKVSIIRGTRSREKTLRIHNI